MRIRALDGLNQLVDDMPRRRTIGITHTEIDDVLATPASGLLELPRDIKHIRRQSFYSGKLFFHGGKISNETDVFRSV